MATSEAQVHEFEAFDGSSGFACTAMVMRFDHGEDCGLPADHPVHRSGWMFGDESAAYLIAATSWPWEREENRQNWHDKMIGDSTLRDQEYQRALRNLQSAYRHLGGTP